MKRALEEAKKGFGEDDGHVAAAYNNLAEVLRNSRQFDKAEPLYLEVGLPSAIIPLLSIYDIPQNVDYLGCC